MSDFYKELAKQLATRWVSMLALPGVLFLAAGWIGFRLGHAHALDLRRFTDTATGAAAQVARWPGAAQALGLIGVALAAALVGLVVQALVGPVRAWCLGQWPRLLATALTGRRRRRWTAVVRRREELQEQHPPHARTPEQQQRIDLIAGRANNIALAEPGRPTWMGDRVHALSQVTVNRYGLDLTFCWPRLWLVLPENTQTEINTAQSGFAAALFTLTWSIPYLVLGAFWWPALLAGLVIAAVGRARARDRIGVLAELTEAALDVHGRGLAIALGVSDESVTGPLDPEEGQRITDIARKGR
ncbi:hypothetical protein [Lentzea terrae]|uniref:hypothetical protein n=1 Tax=Lentzea terrae TaxID=2200761 RepID=UPI000DD4C490|nr:hypothetical protein [Lentzea terrae]